ncbi:MAG: hypothetical protein OXG25_08435 [Gammaproteobacteria bacterium]|nr:hypothetical protein [Gammaproteobacteria bacterium]
MAICSLGVVIFGLFVLVYQDYVEAKSASWQQVTFRVMDSMLPFQERYREEHERYAVGTFDRAQNDLSLAKLIDWHPSVTDSNRYVADVIGTNAFKVTATSRDGPSLCRLYPAKQPCFDLREYLPSGL